MPNAGPSLVPLAILGVVSMTLIGFTIHEIPEGSVGVYWQGGRLTRSISEPGYHVKMPYVTTHEAVQVTLQTDFVSNIPCGTRGGTVITFGKVEVVNRLKTEAVVQTIADYGLQYDKIWIHDKIHHEINQFCTKHSLQEVLVDKFDTIDESLAQVLQSNIDKNGIGLEIFAVRVTKPKVPTHIADNYIKMEEEKTSLLISTERAKVVQKEAETQRLKEVIGAQREAEVARIESELELEKQKTTQQVELIRDEALLNRQKVYADAEFYKAKKSAEADQALLTDRYLKYLYLQGILNNTKLTFGDKIPTTLLGSIANIV